MEKKVNEPIQEPLAFDPADLSPPAPPPRPVDVPEQGGVPTMVPWSCSDLCTGGIFLYIVP